MVERDADGRVVRFVEKPPRGTEPSNLINAGTYVFEPEVLARIPAGRPVSIERDTFPLVAAGGRLHALVTDDYWIDAGRPDTYLQANLDLITGARAETARQSLRVPPWRRRRRSSTRVIGDGAAVGDGAKVCRSVLLPGADVGEGAFVEDSIVAGVIGQEARLSRTVVGADAKIADREQLRDARVPSD